jgi:hypothetical protein
VRYQPLLCFLVCKRCHGRCFLRIRKIILGVPPWNKGWETLLPTLTHKLCSPGTFCDLDKGIPLLKSNDVGIFPISRRNLVTLFEHSQFCIFLTLSCARPTGSITCIMIFSTGSNFLSSHDKAKIHF